MAHFIDDKEIHTIIAISALIDRRDTYTKELADLRKVITYQMERTDGGMSVMGRARLVAQLVNRMEELEQELDTVCDKIARYEPIEIED